MKKIEELFRQDEHTSPLNLSIDSKILIQKIKSVVLVLIICIGLTGNSLNMLIFGQKTMRQVSTFRYLFFLSAANMLVLGIGATDVLIANVFQFEIRSVSNCMCKLHTYATYVVTHSASLILVAVNIERAVFMRNAYICKKNLATSTNLSTKYNSDLDAVEMRPLTSTIKLKAALSGPVKKHSVTIALVLILASVLLFNSHYVFFLRLIRDSSDMQSSVGKHFEFLKEFSAQNTSMYILLLQRLAREQINYQVDICFAERGSPYARFIQNVWFWADMSVYSLVPFVAMSVCSLLIVFGFREMNRNYMRLMHDQNYKYNRRFYARKIKKNRQICLMLVNSNVYFLLSMLQFWLFFFFHGGHSTEKAENVIQLYVYIVLYTNNAFDFLIYGLSSQKYRHELIALFTKKTEH